MHTIFFFRFCLSIRFVRSIKANRVLLFLLLFIAAIYFHMYFFLSIVKVSMPIVALVLRRLISIIFAFFVHLCSRTVNLIKRTEDCSFKVSFSFFSFFLRLSDTEDSPL